ncbi:hypothetical protein C4565_07415 [Candidatus Parcubacteria bacterium]|jgi:hypothetical protein|nr:MAG: hypothetical protein C4565_07415 [Candidatus Parcubacteria bacterium]
MTKYKSFKRMKSEKEMAILFIVMFVVSLPIISFLSFYVVVLHNLDWRSIVFSLAFSIGCSLFPCGGYTCWEDYKKMKKEFEPSR